MSESRISRCSASSALASSSPLSDWPFMSDEERDRRTGRQWVASVKAYLSFCAGDSWRRSRDLRNPDSAPFVDAIRILNGIERSSFDPTFDRPIEEPLTIQEALTDSMVSLYERLPRPCLVRRLQTARPLLTDTKLLSHLSRAKLARMLIEALPSESKV
jgi:hypothetical protein